MGNCSARAKKRRKGLFARADRNNADKKVHELTPASAEDVTYASIDHSTSKNSRTTRAMSDTDCDYSTVNISAALRRQPASDESSVDDCAEDYVLMG